MLARCVIAGFLAATWLATVNLACAADETAAANEQFERQIRPLLAAKCWKCHGPQKQEASLRLDSAAAVAAGGDSGPAVVARRPGP